MFHLFTGYVFHFAQPIIANSAKPMLSRESGCVLHVVVLAVHMWKVLCAKKCT